MKFQSKKNINDAVGKWIVSVSGEEWKSLCKKAKQTSTAKFSMPGFRQGKVPKDLIKKYITESKIMEEAKGLAIRPAYNFAIAQKDDIKPFTSPVPSILKMSKEELIIEFSFDLFPETKIAKYTGFNSIKKNPSKPSKEQIEAQMKKYCDRFAVLSDKENKTIEKGDSVTFDFEGFIDGKPFPNGKAKDFNLEIGSKQFIAGFEEKMIGLKKGDKKDIEVTFPDDYHIDNLKNKPAVFKLNIKNIKNKEIPKMNDEFIKDLNIPSINTKAKFQKYVEDNLISQLAEEEKNRFVGELFREIAKDSKIVIPESIVKKEVKKLKLEFEQKVQAQQLDMKTYKKKTGLSDSDIEKTLFEDAKQRLENGIIIEHVESNEKLELSDKDIEEQYEKLAQKFNIEASKLKDGLFDAETIRSMLKKEKILDFLYINNG